MNYKYYLKKAIISSEALGIWGTILFGMIILFIIQDNGGEKNLEVYMGFGGLFSSGIIIVQYLLLICLNFKYINTIYSIIRFNKINEVYRYAIKSIFLITISFVILVNILAFMIIKIKFSYISLMGELSYIFIVIISQILSFLILGYIFFCMFFYYFNVKITFLITFLVYIIPNMLISELTSSFIIPITADMTDISNIFKILISIHIIFWIYLINFKRMTDSYEN